jgi:hypothetical protein
MTYHSVGPVRHESVIVEQGAIGSLQEGAAMTVELPVGDHHRHDDAGLNLQELVSAHESA